MMKSSPTITDIAKIAGVSIATVSRVLNNPSAVAESLRKRVDQAVQETGYQANPIASNMKSLRRNQIATVIPSLRRNHYTDIIMGIGAVCNEKGMVSVVLESGDSYETEKQVVRALERQWVDGVILIPGRFAASEDEYRQYAERLATMNKRRIPIPVVLLDSPRIDERLDNISVDHETAAFCMAEHLLELGRRNLALVTSAENAVSYPGFRAGVRRALEEYGLEPRQEAFRPGNYTVLDGYWAARDILGSGIPVDGFVCTSDQLAAGVQCACQENGLDVPRDVAIVSYGSVALSIITTPPITTWTVPWYDMGKRAAGMLFERIEGERTQALYEQVEGKLAIRGSTMRSAKKSMDTMFSE